MSHIMEWIKAANSSFCMLSSDCRCLDVSEKKISYYNPQTKWTYNLSLSSSEIINQTVTKAISGYIHGVLKIPQGLHLFYIKILLLLKNEIIYGFYGGSTSSDSPEKHFDTGNAFLTFRIC